METIRMSTNVLLVNLIKPDCHALRARNDGKGVIPGLTRNLYKYLCRSRIKCGMTVCVFDKWLFIWYKYFTRHPPPLAG